MVRLVTSPSCRQLWGEGFEMTKLGERRIENNITGYKVATSVGGLSTGERASEELFVNFSWRLRSANRTRQTQLCITSQDQAVARSAAHTLSASARVSVAARARTAPVSPTIPRTTKCGSRPPRIAGYFACTSR